MPDWPPLDYVQLAISVGLAVVIFLLLLLGLRAIVAKLAGRIDKAMSWPSLVVEVALRTRLWFLVILSIRLVAAFLPLPDKVEEPASFIFVVAAVVQGAIWIRAFILGLVEHRVNASGADSHNLSSAIGLIRLLVSVAVFAIAAILILDNLGVNVTGLVAGLGIGGIAIGLAAQGIFSDLFAALSIIFDKPFRVGDVITYNGKEGPVTGSVEQIGLKSTRIRSLTGELRVIGNAQLLAQEVTNYAGRAVYRLHLLVGVTYQTDPATAEAIPDIMKQITEDAGFRFVRANFTGFGASSIDFELYFEVDTDNIVDAQNSYQKVSLNVLRAFNEKGIEFAYPTQTNFTAAPDGSMIMPFPNMQVQPTD